MAFTKTDQADMNKAIVEYLYHRGYEDTYNVFIGEAKVDTTEDSTRMKNILEKKWKSVARLKKQIMEL